MFRSNATYGNPAAVPGAVYSRPVLRQRRAKNPSRKIFVQGGVLNGKAIDLPSPEYPPGRKSNSSGTVVVKVLVNERGNVVSATATSGHPFLRASAVAAARKAKFAPVALSGLPMKVSGTLVYTFGPKVIATPTVTGLDKDTSSNGQNGDNRVDASPPARARSNVVSGGILNGKAISLPKPAYPPVARAAHASGTVNVQITVDEEGNVISAVAVSGHPLLRAAAVSAARGAKFNPTKLDGVPVKVVGVLVFNFLPLPPTEDGSPPPVATTVPGNSLPQPPRSINGGILNGKAISLPRPAYPPVARAAHASGAVEIQVVVDEEGKVVAAQANGGHPLLRAAAVQAARGAKFEPSLLQGKPVKVFGVILYEFIAE